MSQAVAKSSCVVKSVAMPFKLKCFFLEIYESALKEKVNKTTIHIICLPCITCPTLKEDITLATFYFQVIFNNASLSSFLLLVIDVNCIWDPHKP